MKKRFPLLFLLSLLSLITACQKELPPVEVTAGTAQMPSLLTIGDGFLAGYYNGGLTPSGQLQSPGKILHQQLGLVNNDIVNYQQALVQGDSGSGSQFLREIYKDTCGIYQPIITQTTAATNWSDLASGAFNEIVVPLMPVSVLGMEDQPTIPLGYEEYLERFVTASSKQSFTKNALQAHQNYPDAFKVLWLGTYDVLNYARKGGGYIDTLYENGIVKGIDVSPAEQGVEYLTDEDTFEAMLYPLLEGLLADKSGNGFICNVPVVYNFPFFTLATPTFLNADTVRLDSVRYLMNCETYHEIWIKSDRNKDGIVDTVIANPDTDRLLLNVLTDIGKPLENGLHFGLSKSAPLHNAYVLDRNEQELCLRSINLFNRIIGQAAKQVELPVFDAKTLFERVEENSIYYSGIRFNYSYINGHFFSLDGMHLTPRANAVLVNEWLRFMEQEFGANVPKVDVTKFDGIVIP